MNHQIGIVSIAYTKLRLMKNFMGDPVLYRIILRTGILLEAVGELEILTCTDNHSIN